MFYEWTDSLSVGVPSIDRQHKVLITLINDLHIAIDTGKGSDISKFILGKLVNYAKAHFIYEESLFKGQNYAETEKHLLSHRKIEEQLGKLMESSKDSKFDLPEELMEFLKSWLNNHILKEDMGYSDLLIKNNIQ